MLVSISQLRLAIYVITNFWLRNGYYEFFFEFGILLRYNLDFLVLIKVVIGVLIIVLSSVYMIFMSSHY